MLSRANSYVIGIATQCRRAKGVGNNGKNCNEGKFSQVSTVVFYFQQKATAIFWQPDAGGRDAWLYNH